MSIEAKEIENKINEQVEHIIRSYEGEELKIKIYDLSIEWYLKGIIKGSERVK